MTEHVKSGEVWQTEICYPLVGRLEHLKVMYQALIQRWLYLTNTRVSFLAECSLCLYVCVCVYVCAREQVHTCEPLRLSQGRGTDAASCPHLWPDLWRSVSVSLWVSHAA